MKTNVPTRIFALGGVEEIGKNMYIVEHDDELVIVDCGVKFADENELPGVSGIIPTFDYLIENQSKIKGLLVTHAHEDHIGGISHLLRAIKIPKIYAAKLTSEIIKKKLHEHKDLTLPNFEIIDDNKTIKTKNFVIDFFRVTHSIPDSFGICISTSNGNIVSTGDYRFDFSTQGDETDLAKIGEIAQRNVDVLLAESTNADTPGFSDSEIYILDEIKRIIKNSIGRVFVATFASNLGRIEEIIDIAIKLGRKIVIIGKSMETNVDTSIKVGFLNVTADAFVETRNISNYKDNEILVLSTGSQGEEMAALNMMAMGKHPWISLKPTDTIIMSSNPIPGNFESVEKLVNKLYRSGIKIIQNTPSCKLHASGHATRSEQQLMIKLINPQYLVPIHGEYKMLRSLKNNAIMAGMHPDNIIQTTNGQILELSNRKLTLTDSFVPSEEVYIDGGKSNHNTKGMLKVRRILNQDGIFSITITIDRINKKLIDLPIISTRGSFYAKNSTPLISKIAYSIKENIEKNMNQTNEPINSNSIRKIVENTTDYFIWKNKKKHPLIRTTIFDIDNSING